jgi:hypothetical protein
LGAFFMKWRPIMPTDFADWDYEGLDSEDKGYRSQPATSQPWHSSVVVLTAKTDGMFTTRQYSSARGKRSSST